MSENKEGQLRVWWIPQVPMKSFKVPVGNLREAKLILDTLAYYDKFQLDNNIKPDYINVGGLSIFEEEEGEWLDWHDEESGDDFDQYCKNNPELVELVGREEE